MSVQCVRCRRTLYSGNNFCNGCMMNVDTIDTERKVKVSMLWRMLGKGDVIQPGDVYSSSLSGGLYRCLPSMMGKALPYMSMPHLRPAGTREESIL